MDASLIAAFVALGCVIGFLAGLLGIGGTMIMVPILTILFTHEHFPRDHVVHIAVATAMATIVFTSLSNMHAHNRHGAVLWPVVRGLVPGILLGSLVGPLIVSGMSAHHAGVDLRAVRRVFRCADDLGEGAQGHARIARNAGPDRRRHGYRHPVRNDRRRRRIRHRALPRALQRAHPQCRRDICGARASDRGVRNRGFRRYRIAANGITTATAWVTSIFPRWCASRRRACCSLPSAQGWRIAGR